MAQHGLIESRNRLASYLRAVEGRLKQCCRVFYDYRRGSSWSHVDGSHGTQCVHMALNIGEKALEACRMKDTSTSLQHACRFGTFLGAHDLIASGAEWINQKVAGQTKGEFSCVILPSPPRIVTMTSGTLQ